MSAFKVRVKKQFSPVVPFMSHSTHEGGDSTRARARTHTPGCRTNEAEERLCSPTSMPLLSLCQHQVANRESENHDNMSVNRKPGGQVGGAVGAACVCLFDVSPRPLIIANMNTENIGRK